VEVIEKEQPLPETLEVEQRQWKERQGDRCLGVHNEKCPLWHHIAPMDVEVFGVELQGDRAIFPAALTVEHVNNGDPSMVVYGFGQPQRTCGEAGAAVQVLI